MGLEDSVGITVLISVEVRAKVRFNRYVVLASITIAILPPERARFSVIRPKANQFRGFFENGRPPRYRDQRDNAQVRLPRDKVPIATREDHRRVSIYGEMRRASRRNVANLVYIVTKGGECNSDPSVVVTWGVTQDGLEHFNSDLPGLSLFHVLRRDHFGTVLTRFFFPASGIISLPIRYLLVFTFKLSPFSNPFQVLKEIIVMMFMPFVV